MVPVADGYLSGPCQGDCPLPRSGPSVGDLPALRPVGRGGGGTAPLSVAPRPALCALLHRRGMVWPGAGGMGAAACRGSARRRSGRLCGGRETRAWGKRWAVQGDLGGGRIIKKKQKQHQKC